MAPQWSRAWHHASSIIALTLNRRRRSKPIGRSRPNETDELAAFRRRFADFPLKMSGRDFERYCASLLRDQGRQAQAIGGAGDQGADIVGIKNGKKAVFQCKLHARAAGNSAVQQIAAAKNHYGAGYAAVIGRSGCTASARDLATSNRVKSCALEDLDTFYARGIPSKRSKRPRKRRRQRPKLQAA